MGTVGIEWVDNYHGRQSDLKNCGDNCRGFYNAISGEQAYDHGDDNCVDENFESLDDTVLPYTDTVELVYFSGHGSPFALLFGIATRDNGQARPERMKLGRGRLKWIVFDACGVLQRDGEVVWHQRLRPAFAGLHYMLGFDNDASDSDDRGRMFAHRLNAGEPIREAWARTCVETEDDDVCYAYMRARIEGSDSYDDHWVGRGAVSESPREDGAANYFYLRSHC